MNKNTDFSEFLNFDTNLASSAALDAGDKEPDDQGRNSNVSKFSRVRNKRSLNKLT
jgi:hypothetical protein